jgi:hypothetical protein
VKPATKASYLEIFNKTMQDSAVSPATKRTFAHLVLGRFVDLGIKKAQKGLTKNETIEYRNSHKSVDLYFNSIVDLLPKRTKNRTP